MGASPPYFLRVLLLSLLSTFHTNKKIIMQYKVTSKIVKLDQVIRSTTHTHDSGMQRTVEWLKDTEDGEFFSLDEAADLKNYLDTKKNFADNKIVEVTEDDLEPSVADLMIHTKDLEDGNIEVSEPIKITQCTDLRDYNLPFEVEGHLNIIDLT